MWPKDVSSLCIIYGFSYMKVVIHKHYLYSFVHLGSVLLCAARFILCGCLFDTNPIFAVA